MSDRRFDIAPKDATPSLVDAAGDAFLEANYELSRELLRIALEAGEETGRAALLASRIARVENRVADMYAYATTATQRLPRGEAHTVATALRAISAEQLGNAEESARLRRDLDAQGMEKVAPLARYLLATDYWARGDADRADALAQMNIDSSQYVPESRSVLAWSATKHERYRDAIPHFLQALAEIRSAPRPDRRFQAVCVVGVCAVAQEFADLELAKTAKLEYERMPWSTGTRVSQHQALNTLRFVAMLEGDLEGAWLLARQAVALAPAPVYVAISEIISAEVSRLLGDMAAMRIHLDQAWKTIRSEQWSEFDVDARLALSSFAFQASRERPADARKAMTIYASIAQKDFPLSILNGDRRIAAFERTAAARVAQASGDRARAIELFESSFAIWDGLGYVMRAAQDAADLLRLTGDPKYRAPIDRLLERAPKAWLRAEIDRDAPSP